MKLVTIADAVVLALAGALVLWLYATLWVSPGEGTAAVIAAPDNVSRVVLLEGTGRMQIAGAIGPSTIVWDERGIRFLQSPCRAQYCVHTGWLRHAGEVAACLPNGVTIELRGKNERYDAIAF